MNSAQPFLELDKKRGALRLTLGASFGRVLLALALLVTILMHGEESLGRPDGIADKDDVGNGEGHSLMSVGRLVRVRRLFQSLGPVHLFVFFHVDDLTLSLHQLEKSTFRLTTSWLRAHPTATDAARNA